MKVIHVVMLISLLFTFGCQKIDTALLGGNQDTQATIEGDIDALQL
ncbi:hypothetical protein PDESU_05316 [Pontiella desulfatans]|uniref:Uncharacterized protein n=1 Tax=Pontiella desulfatans TaxID=2750659 RepID=A0A6C2U9Q6_PONDE|nr:hypothetical protein PDESU_05316 [Pontiella desulfatans]